MLLFQDQSQLNFGCKEKTMSEWIRRLAEKYSEVNESQKAALAKKLAKASASSEKGKAAVTLPKAPFEIPEDIPANERTAFHGAAAGAHKAGKSHFTFQGKKYPVTMKKDTAQAIADDVKEAKVDEISMGKMQAYGKAAAKDIEQKRNKVKAALDQPASVKHAKAGMKAMQGLTKRSKGSDMYVDKMTGRSKVKPTAEAADLDKTNVDKAIRHDCATHVEHAEWGKGQPISEMHTIVETAPGEGYVTHYDVMFEHGIEKNVAVEDLTILAEMSHGHAKKKSKNEMSSKEKMKRGLYNGSKDDEEVVMNPKKEKKEKSTETDNMAQESVTPPVYARILEARATADADGKHKGKGADPESWDEKEKNNKGAMDMKKDHKGPTIDNPEAGDQMTKAANAAPNAAARKGDNAAGDKKIIPSATPMKGM